MENRKLYVAYGSNMNIGQMARRCPTAEVIGKSVLKGYRLLFRGDKGHAVATVEPQDGGKVPVLVWSIAPKDEAALDRYEEFPSLYRKKTITVELGGKPFEAMIYIMNVDYGNKQVRQENMPHPFYYAIILDGYKAFGFDMEILKNATIKKWDFDKHQS